MIACLPPSYWLLTDLLSCLMNGYCLMVQSYPHPPGQLSFKKERKKKKMAWNPVQLKEFLICDWFLVSNGTFSGFSIYFFIFYAKPWFQVSFLFFLLVCVCVVGGVFTRFNFGLIYKHSIVTIFSLGKVVDLFQTPGCFCC